VHGSQSFMMAQAGVEPVTCLLQDIFERYDQVLDERQREERRKLIRRTTLENYLEASTKKEQNGFVRMQKCRHGLEALDRRGWTRSFHQRMFHDNFIRSCARIFWKREPHGTFAKDHQKILEVNGWDHLAQEVLVSTPRRFGKTISVSMFAAAMLYSCPNLEMSIYSTCKVRRMGMPAFALGRREGLTRFCLSLLKQRISQKLLRNIQKFLELIYLETGCSPMKEIRINMEEIVLQGTECEQDVRVVNSYPSKVRAARPPPYPARSASDRPEPCPACKARQAPHTARNARKSGFPWIPAGHQWHPAGNAGLTCTPLRSPPPASES
jgi:hypothetical protein